MAIQDYEAGTRVDRALASGFDEALPAISESEILAFHAADPTRGAIIVSREGAYDTIVMSLEEHAPTRDLVRELWGVVGREATAVLAGEELEVDGSQIEALIESGDLPASLDLCEAAIAKVQPPSLEESVDTGLEHGGRWILRHLAS